jgi:hypothetical protein
MINDELERIWKWPWPIEGAAYLNICLEGLRNITNKSLCMVYVAAEIRMQAQSFNCRKTCPVSRCSGYATDRETGVWILTGARDFSLLFVVQIGSEAQLHIQRVPAHRSPKVQVKLTTHPRLASRLRIRYLCLHFPCLRGVGLIDNSPLSATFLWYS